MVIGRSRRAPARAWACRRGLALLDADLHLGELRDVLGDRSSSLSLPSSTSIIAATEVIGLLIE